MRVVMVAVLIAGGLAAGLLAGGRVGAEPQTCPTVCDQIPNTAWIDPAAVPLNAVYHWPALAGIAAAVTGTAPQFQFEQLCASAPVRQDPRNAAVGARAVVTPEGQWQLQAQVLHWRGDAGRSGQLAAGVFNTARAALRACQRGAPDQSPSITVDEPTRLAAVISGPVNMHTYLVKQPQSGTISELTLWVPAPPPAPWPVIQDDQVLDALTSPLCGAYISSCQ